MLADGAGYGNCRKGTRSYSLSVGDLKMECLTFIAAGVKLTTTKALRSDHPFYMGCMTPQNPSCLTRICFVSHIVGRCLHCPFTLQQTTSGSKNKFCSDDREPEER